ncbi:hypothetical protein DPEC_G00366100 [Dallia pectoralis]|nr:hypothetical protein DPEC_G00366100 [Dallia pectoralis]
MRYRPRPGAGSQGCHRCAHGPARPDRVDGRFRPRLTRTGLGIRTGLWSSSSSAQRAFGWACSLWLPPSCAPRVPTPPGALSPQNPRMPHAPSHVPVQAGHCPAHLVPEDPSMGDKVARVIVYAVAMIYMFLGVSIIADRFMAAIEVITSQGERDHHQERQRRDNNGHYTSLEQGRLNLTLMALGSSTPEILLSVIEVCGHDFQAGELGPSTIVGSAAFNMFVIIGLCVSVIPEAGREGQTSQGVLCDSRVEYLRLHLAVHDPGSVQSQRGPDLGGATHAGLLSHLRHPGLGGRPATPLLQVHAQEVPRRQPPPDVIIEDGTRTLKGIEMMDEAGARWPTPLRPRRRPGP